MLLSSPWRESLAWGGSIVACTHHGYRRCRSAGMAACSMLEHAKQRVHAQTLASRLKTPGPSMPRACTPCSRRLRGACLSCYLAPACTHCMPAMAPTHAAFTHARAQVTSRPTHRGWGCSRAALAREVRSGSVRSGPPLYTGISPLSAMPTFLEGLPEDEPMASTLYTTSMPSMTAAHTAQRQRYSHCQSHCQSASPAVCVHAAQATSTSAQPQETNHGAAHAQLAPIIGAGTDRIMQRARQGARCAAQRAAHPCRTRRGGRPASWSRRW